MKLMKINKGKDAEQDAYRFLEANGLKLITKNFRCFCGEIDLIMRHKDSIVFIEVRYRKSSSYSTGIESVSHIKQGRLQKTAFYYLQQQASSVTNLNYRFDIVGINEFKNFQWIQNAFEVTHEYF